MAKQAVAEVVSNGFVVKTGTPPTKRRAGRKQLKYPINSLELNQYFIVPVSDEVPDPAATIQSTISNARAFFAIPEVDDNGQPVMETVTVREYERDDDGKILKDAEGKRAVKSTHQEERQKTYLGRDFYVETIAEGDAEGPGARVWRVL